MSILSEAEKRPTAYAESFGVASAHPSRRSSAKAERPSFLGFLLS